MTIQKISGIIKIEREREHTKNNLFIHERENTRATPKEKRENMEKAEKVLLSVDGLTETGRVKAAVRDNLKAQVEKGLFADWEVENDGSLSLPLAKDDATGKIIKVRVKMTITAQEDFAVRGSKKEEKETVIPSLFG